ncbi:MAG: HlyC/CorC family transporter [Acaryochloridaceae cyanobacterium RL_2_7]|nr:HlyC/CorC family transporter [Acaryochloridaceae cyanobacterium RL_2_7]
MTAEFSIVSVRRSRIQQLVLEGDTQARTVQSLQRDINRLLSTTQIGITLSCLALGWISETIVSSVVVTRIFAPLHDVFLLNSSFIHTIAIALVFLLVAYLQIVLGELGPKTLALRYSESLARSFGPLSFSISKLLYPFVWLLNHSTELLLGAFGIQFSDEELFGQVTTKELQLLVEASPVQSEDQEEDRQLLRNFLEFGEVEVKELMVPRTNVDFFSMDGTYQDFMSLIARADHDSYPVMNQSLDDVRGVIRLRDLAGAIASNKISLDSPMSDWVTPTAYVNEDTAIQDALYLMIKIDQKILMVREEDVGGTAGLIHLTDILSVIVNNPDEPEDESTQILFR